MKTSLWAEVVARGQSTPPDLEEMADPVVIQHPPGYGETARKDIYVSTRTGYPIAKSGPTATGLKCFAQTGLVVKVY